MYNKSLKSSFCLPGKEENCLREWMDRLSMQGQVHFHPVVAQTFEMLAMLDIVVSPSRNEGLGLSIMEAQAMALPVIGTNVGGIPSVIEDGKTGLLIESENPQAIARAVKRLVRDVNFRRDIAIGARQSALEKYSSDIMVDQTLECYRHVAR